MEHLDQQPQPTLSASSLFGNYKLPERKAKIVNERQAILAEALEKINRDRVGTKYKPMTGKGIAMKVAHVSTPDLKDFLMQCGKYKGGFSKCFFGSLRVK